MNQTRIVCALRTMLTSNKDVEGLLYVSCFERPRALTPIPEVGMLRMLLVGGQTSGQYGEGVTHPHYTTSYSLRYGRQSHSSEVWMGKPTRMRRQGAGTMAYTWNPSRGYMLCEGKILPC